MPAGGKPLITNFTATRISDNKVRLDWDVSYYGDPNNVYQAVFWRINGGDWQFSGGYGGGTGYDDTTVSVNNKYEYHIAASYRGAENYYYSPILTIYTSPAAPSDAAVSRVSDTRQNVSWSLPANSANSWERTRIQRWDNVTGKWYDLKVLTGGSVSGHADTTTRSDRQYRYRVRGENSAGNSAWNTTDYIYTTPRTPTSVTAARVGADIKVAWGNSSTIATAVRLQRRKDGGAWGSDVVLAGGATEYLHTTPGPGIWEYRVRTEASPRESAYVLSNTAEAIAPPAAPDSLSPASSALDGAEGQKFAWTHNPLDGTAQTKYSLRYREQGAAWPGNPQIEAEVSGDNEHIFAAEIFANGKTYEWQARTWGQDADPSNWSSTAVFTASARPIVTITYPAADEDAHDNPALTVDLLYGQVESLPQTGLIVRLYDVADSDKLVYSRQLAGAIESHVIDYDLLNERSYRLVVLVQSSIGLWSLEAKRLFDVIYTPPPTPELNVDYVEAAATATIRVTNEPDPPATLYNRVYRRIDGGAPVLIADHVPPGSALTDYIPGISNTNTYHAVAVSEIGSIAASDPVDAAVKLRANYWLNSGAAFSDGLKLLWNPEFQETQGRETALHRFAGRRYPVGYQSEAQQQVVDISALIKWEDKARYERVLIENYGPICYRDHFGRRFFAVCNDAPKLAVAFRGYYRLSLQLVRIEHNEEIGGGGGEGSWQPPA